MSNETETAVTPKTDEDSSWSTLDGSNGRPPEGEAAEQYRSVQEAQLSHERSIEELREEVRKYREQLASLSSRSPGPAIPIDAVKLRLDALEQKIGESASDPLLNEIVHRLAALESGAGPRSNDPRVREIAVEVEKLQKRSANPAPPDPRTDDLVLRIASLESGLKRSQDSSSEARLLFTRVEKLETEAQDAQQQRFAQLGQQVQEVRERLEQHTGELPAPEVLSRLSGVEAALEGCVTGSSFEQLSSKVQGLEESPELEDAEARARLESLESSAATQEALEALSSKLDALENKPESATEWARADEVAEQVSHLKVEVSEFREQLSGHANLASVAKLEERLGELESANSDSAWMPAEEARTQFTELQSRIANQSGQDSLSELEIRLTQLETFSANPELGGHADLAAVTKLEERLVELEGEYALSAWMPAEEAQTQFTELRERLASQTDQDSLSELDARITQLETAGANAESGSHADEASLARLEERLSKVEGANSTSEWMPAEEARAQLNELKERLAGQSDQGSLSELEDRLAQIEASGLSSDGISAEEVRRTVADLESKIEKGSLETSQEKPWSELQSRLDLLETSGAEGLDGEHPRLLQLSDRLHDLEQRLEAVSIGDGDPEVGTRLADLGNHVSTLLANQSDGGGGIDPGAFTELQERFAQFESRPANSTDGVLRERLAQIESVHESIFEPGLQELTERLRTLEESKTEAGNDETWSQWARNTLAEVGELRQEVENLRQSGAAGGSLDEGSLVQLGKGISESMNKAETRSLRAQMYFVYFTLGMLWMVVLYFVIQLRGGL